MVLPLRHENRGTIHHNESIGTLNNYGDDNHENNLTQNTYLNPRNFRTKGGEQLKLGSKNGNDDQLQLAQEQEQNFWERR